MMTIMPVIIPVDTTPSKCPECGKDEDKIEVCNHCGYEYPKEKRGKLMAWWKFFVLICGIIGILFPSILGISNTDYLGNLDFSGNLISALFWVLLGIVVPIMVFEIIHIFITLFSK